MPTSSAKPARLLQYRDDGLTQVEEWEPEVGKLETALQGLREALSGLDLPAEVDLGFIPFHETWFDSLTQNQRHLDEWVGDVANEFIRAEGLNPADFDRDALNLSMTVNDSQIVVGFADRYESEEQAREDAAALDAILGEYGLIHPYELANNPELLEEMAEQYPELRDILARSERFANDESYAAELVNTLGPQNVRTMADLTNTFGLAYDQGYIQDDAYLGYVVPFAAILGAADRSGRMDESVRNAIFDMDATDEPPIEGTGTDSIQEAQLQDMRYRSLALLVGTGDFSAQTTADMAYEIFHNGPVHPEFYDYSGFTNAGFLRDHHALASNELAAVVALQGDDEAANVFFQMDRDDYPGELENLALMQGSEGSLHVEVAAERLGLPQEEVAGWFDEAMANAMTGGILEYPLATGETYSEETLNLVSRTIEAAGWEHIDASAPVRQALAQISAPYTNDLAIIAAGGGQDFPETRLPGVDQDELRGFMQEVSQSESGRVGLAQNAAALVYDQIGAEASDIVDPEQAAHAFGRGSALAEAYYREMGEAWHDVNVSRHEAREAAVAGWRSVTDPVVDLVSGKIVEKIPVVNVAADLPLVSNVVDGVTGTIEGSINDAVYNTLIPEPDLEAMTTWSAAIEPEVRDAVAKSLYDAPETREHFFELAQQDEPELWAEINADGEVNLDEFRQISDVQDAVHTYAGRITTGFQTEMAFNEVFKDPA